MFRAAILAGGALLALSTAASADYYVVREKSSRDCKVVETRPTGGTWIQVGPVGFSTRDEADRQVKVICREREPAGDGAGEGVVIERRERRLD